MNRQLLKKMVVLVITVCALAGQARAVVIKDICNLRGLRENRLVGYGLVTGLQGTGDGKEFQPAIDALIGVIQKLHPSEVLPRVTDAKAVAIVSVTATVPAFNNPGEKIDVKVSCFGPAKSLKGGRLLMTPLHGGGDKVYAWAEGSLNVNGENLKNGVINNGGIMEQKVPRQYVFDGKIFFELNFNDADFTTARNIAQAINDNKDQFGVTENMASALSANVIEVTLPKLINTEGKITEFISELERTRIHEVGIGALVVINTKTKTVVATGDVEISAGVVAHKNLTVNIGPEVTNLNKFYETVIGSTVYAVPDPNPPDNTKLDQLLQALRQFKATPEELIEIIRALKRAKLLHARVIEVEN